MKTRMGHGRQGLALVTVVGVAGLAGLALVMAPRVAGGVYDAGAERSVCHLTLPLAEGEALQILNTSGRIAVSECEGDAVELTITCESHVRGSAIDYALRAWRGEPLDSRSADEPVVRENERGVQVSTLGSAPSSGTVVSYHFDVKLPRGRNLEVTNGNGAIGVAGIEGDVLAYSDNGDVRCDDVSGSVSSRVRNGGVYCRYVAGGIDVNTANGPIEIDAIPAQHYPVRAWSANGAIKFRGQSAAVRLRATTENGRIIRELESSDAEVRQTVHTLDLNGGEGTAEVGLHALNGNVYVDSI